MTKEYIITLKVPDDEPLSIAALEAIGYAGKYAQGWLQGCWNQMDVDQEQVAFTDIHGVSASITRIA